MTLARLLEIDRKLLRWEEERGLEFAERVWAEKGRPAERRRLIELLEEVLQLCQQEGLTYPAVFLKRKKQLERRDWLPQSQGVGTEVSRTAAGAVGVCPDCGGTGVAPNPGGQSAQLCGCGAWRRRYGTKPEPSAA